MAQAFIIGNVVNHYTRSREEFQLNLFDNLFYGNFDHRSMRNKEEGPGHPQVAHVLMETPIGSRSDTDATGRRKYRSSCVMCPNKLEGAPRGSRYWGRGTPYYCVQCLVPLHPECSAAYHASLCDESNRKPPREAYARFLQAEGIPTPHFPLKK